MEIGNQGRWIWYYFLDMRNLYRNIVSFYQDLEKIIRVKNIHSQMR